jgi:nucleotide-binding universal stress UspA family protein
MKNFSERVGGQETPTPVLVGVDGSPSAQNALDWAAAEASATRRPLHIVHCFSRPVMELPLGISDDFSEPRRVMELPPATRERRPIGGISSADGVLAQAELSARLAAPDVKATTELVVAAPAPALLHRAEEAALVVLGSRGLGGCAALLVGSVSQAVAGHAACPVVVVRPRPHHRRSAPRVVVGVDGSEVSTPAVDFAFETAARRGAGLTAVLAMSPPRTARRRHKDPAGSLADDPLRLLTKALDEAWRRWPNVPVTLKLASTRPSDALVAESTGADLVVVGSRGRGGLRGSLLGSVSQVVVHDARCPVAVVRPHRSGSHHSFTTSPREAQEVRHAQ